MTKLISGLGWDRIHTSFPLVFWAGVPKFTVKVYNKMTSHCFVPFNKLKGEICTVVKAGKTSETDTDGYRPVINFS